MSYCRFSDGDVYMYPHIDGYIECCFCSLAQPDGYRLQHFHNHKDALGHLLEHRKAGHHVPQYAIDRLTVDMKRAELENLLWELCSAQGQIAKRNESGLDWGIDNYYKRREELMDEILDIALDYRRNNDEL